MNSLVPIIRNIEIELVDGSFEKVSFKVEPEILDYIIESNSSNTLKSEITSDIVNSYGCMDCGKVYDDISNVVDEIINDR